MLVKFRKFYKKCVLAKKKVQGFYYDTVLIYKALDYESKRGYYKYWLMLVKLWCNVDRYAVKKILFYIGYFESFNSIVVNYFVFCCRYLCNLMFDLFGNFLNFFVLGSRMFHHYIKCAFALIEFVVISFFELFVIFYSYIKYMLQLVSRSLKTYTHYNRVFGGVRVIFKNYSYYFYNKLSVSFKGFNRPKVSLFGFTKRYALMYYFQKVRGIGHWSISDLLIFLHKFNRWLSSALVGMVKGWFRFKDSIPRNLSNLGLSPVLKYLFRLVFYPLFYLFYGLLNIFSKFLPVYIFVKKFIFFLLYWFLFLSYYVVLLFYLIISLLIRFIGRRIKARVIRLIGLSWYCYWLCFVKSIYLNFKYYFGYFLAYFSIYLGVVVNHIPYIVSGVLGIRFYSLYLGGKVIVGYFLYILHVIFYVFSYSFVLVRSLKKHGVYHVVSILYYEFLGFWVILRRRYSRFVSGKKTKEFTGFFYRVGRYSFKILGGVGLKLPYLLLMLFGLLILKSLFFIVVWLKYVHLKTQSRTWSDAYRVGESRFLWINDRSPFFEWLWRCLGKDRSMVLKNLLLIFEWESMLVYNNAYLQDLCSHNKYHHYPRWGFWLCMSFVFLFVGIVLALLPFTGIIFESWARYSHTFWEPELHHLGDDGAYVMPKNLARYFRFYSELKNEEYEPWENLMDPTFPHSQRLRLRPWIGAILERDIWCSSDYMEPDYVDADDENEDDYAELLLPSNWYNKNPRSNYFSWGLDMFVDKKHILHNSYRSKYLATVRESNATVSYFRILLGSLQMVYRGVNMITSNLRGSSFQSTLWDYYHRDRMTYFVRSDIIQYIAWRRAYSKNIKRVSRMYLGHGGAAFWIGQVAKSMPSFKVSSFNTYLKKHKLKKRRHIREGWFFWGFGRLTTKIVGDWFYEIDYEYRSRSFVGNLPTMIHNANYAFPLPLRRLDTKLMFAMSATYLAILRRLSDQHLFHHTVVENNKVIMRSRVLLCEKFEPVDWNILPKERYQVCLPYMPSNKRPRSLGQIGSFKEYYFVTGRSKPVYSLYNVHGNYLLLISVVGVTGVTYSYFIPSDSPFYMPEVLGIIGEAAFAYYFREVRMYDKFIFHSQGKEMELEIKSRRWRRRDRAWVAIRGGFYYRQDASEIGYHNAFRYLFYDHFQVRFPDWMKFWVKRPYPPRNFSFSVVEMIYFDTFIYIESFCGFAFEYLFDSFVRFWEYDVCWLIFLIAEGWIMPVVEYFAVLQPYKPMVIEAVKFFFKFF